MTPLSLEAPAKLNLSLRVVGRREDGYHELDSILVLLDLADRLLLMPGCSGLRVTDADGAPVPDVPVRPDENLAWRGLADGLGGDPDAALACLTLEKRIPAAAGLGGGSSDAAAAWRLGRRWAGRPDRPTEVEVAALARIGADVPFFASGAAAARVTGIGERVAALAAAAGQLVLLVHPPFGLSTAAVFDASRARDWSGSAPGSVAEALAEGTNDLLPAARRVRPELDDLMALMLAAGAVPRLTGSGATLYAVLDDPERAPGIIARLARAGLRATTGATRPAAASIGT
ncbi:MAG: 4-(cytidine 5'-diphospho)-2-C-methyl-D-erythritol kinase [Chloroflexota bacterium]